MAYSSSPAVSAATIDDSAADSAPRTAQNTTVVPGQPDWIISRPRLVERLVHGSRGPLTVVSGPPGAGKTAAVRSWAASRHGRSVPVGWVTCNFMRPEAWFWPSLIQALADAGVDCDGLSVGDADFLPALAARLTEHGGQVVLVLDDFHPAPGSPVAEMMTWLLEHSQPVLRLILLARHDPPLPLYRYQLAQELTEIRGADLAFNRREIRDLLAQHHLDLPAGSVSLLAERTEGWAAGVRLAAMSMESQRDPRSFVERFAGDDRAVVDYLFEQVLAVQPPQIRQALLVSSVAERFNAELVDELCGSRDGGLFAEMVKRNAFLLREGGGWYRYQRLFGEAMRVIFAHENPGGVIHAHRSAAAWFGRRGLLTEAVHHAVRAGDTGFACWLVVNQHAIGEVIGLCSDHGLGDEFRRNGDHPSGTEPELDLVTAATALSRGDDLMYADALGRALERLANSPPAYSADADLAAAIIELTHLLYTCPGDPSLADLSDRTEELLASTHRGDAGTRPELTALVNLGRGMQALWAGRVPEAGNFLTTAAQESATEGSDFLRRTILAHLALSEALMGRFGRASEFASKAGQLPEVCPPPARRLSAVHIALAWTHLESYELSAARRELDRASVALTEADACSSALYGLVRAHLEFAEGRMGCAQESIRTAARAATALPWLRRRITMAEAMFGTPGADPRGLLRTIARTDDRPSGDVPVALAGLQLREGDREAAADTLRPVLSEGVAMPVDVRVTAWLLDALLAYTTGEAPRGRRSLDRALRLAERECIRLPFVLAAQWLYPLLRRDAELCQAHRRLLDPLGLDPHPAVDSPPDPTGTLTSREHEVLQQLAQMMTTEEIAAEKFLSVNTIKAHLKSIYRKLGVTRRGEAVRRARQLSLL